MRKIDNKNYYEINLHHNIDSNTPEIRLVKYQDGQDTEIFKTTSIPLVSKESYHVKIEVVGEHIQMWVGSSLAIDLDDPGTTLKNGSVFLSYWTGAYGKSVVLWDNIVITELQKTKLPVIFIPGVGGSELQANQDIFWSQDNGHGGTYSHAYPAGEKVWVNQNEAIKLGDDDYFDVLRLNPDGVTATAPGIGLTGNLTPFGYSDIDNFFTGMGYVKGVNYFIFPYDWRKDLSPTNTTLDQLIDQAIKASGQSKINLVVHSMGGLVARNYISDSSKASKVNKLIELGVPHLGIPSGLKTFLYGFALVKNVLGIFPFGIPASEIHDIAQNSTGLFQLLPDRYPIY